MKVDEIVHLETDIPSKLLLLYTKYVKDPVDRDRLIQNLQCIHDMMEMNPNKHRILNLINIFLKEIEEPLALLTELKHFFEEYRNMIKV